MVTFMNSIRSRRLPVRRLTIAAALLALEAAAFAPAPGYAATLRPNVVVHGDTVRLRDIFDGAGKNAETILFRAPAPGQSVVLPGKWLHQVARSYGLDWHPGPGLDESRVQRSSNRIGPEMIVSTLSKALEKRIDGRSRFEIALDNPSTEIQLPVQQQTTMVVHNLNFDPRSRRFSALIMAPDDGPGAVSLPVAGRVYEMISVPVLSKRMHNGDIIREQDMETELRRADSLDANTVTAADQAIGKSARRTLLRGRTLSSGDLREPQLVTRGSLVVMTYQTANMSITAYGTARENGTKGDTVRVRNTNSGKVIEAVVTGPDSVAVMPLTSTVRR